MDVKRIIDISWSIYPGMAVWPGDDNVEIKKSKQMTAGDDYNVSSINMGLHTGTHADAPFHFVDEGATVDKLDLTKFIGFVNVYELKVDRCITENDIKNLPIKEGDIVFFKTSNSSLQAGDDFYKDFIYIDPSAAQFLVERKVKSVGVDYLSVGSYDSALNYATHRTLLLNGIGVIEGLYLKEVCEGRYFFSALPIKIAGAEGSPVRAVLAEIE